MRIAWIFVQVWRVTNSGLDLNSVLKIVSWRLNWTSMPKQAPDFRKTRLAERVVQLLTALQPVPYAPCMGYLPAFDHLGVTVVSFWDASSRRFTMRKTLAGEDSNRKSTECADQHCQREGRFASCIQSVIVCHCQVGVSEINGKPKVYHGLSSFPY